MAQDYSSIGPYNSTAQKEAMPLIGLIILAGIVGVVMLYIVGTIANSI
ncbi:MAG TPA: hypothetical protein VJX67_00910 [Blastocatellia bacterium]|nr:hypothetical protein [Blastocatellia bacterium]